MWKYILILYIDILSYDLHLLIISSTYLCMCVYACVCMHVCVCGYTCAQRCYLHVKTVYLFLSFLYFLPPLLLALPRTSERHSIQVIRTDILQFGSVHSLSCVWLFVTPWTTACQASLSIISDFRGKYQFFSTIYIISCSIL